MTIIGIDIGITKIAPCGLAVYESYGGHVLHTCTIKPMCKSDDVDERIADIGTQIDEELLEHDNVQAIAYEMPYVGENAATTIKLAKMCGAVVMLAALRGLPVYGVQPTAAKVALTGIANADKGHMQRAANIQYKVGNITSHEADAIGVALAGWALYKSAHLEVIA